MTFWQFWCVVWFALAWSAVFFAWRVWVAHRRSLADRMWFVNASRQNRENQAVNWSELLELQKARLAERDSLASQSKALRTALVFVVGYVSRLEDEIRIQFAAGRTRDLLDTAPPIMAMVDAINTKDWAAFDRVAHGQGKITS